MKLGPVATALAAASLLAAGCGNADRESEVAAAAERFHGALARGDGAAACEQLSEETTSKLEQQAEQPCEDVILSLELPQGGTPSSARVYLTTAVAVLPTGGATFLDETAQGWRVSAAGCNPTAPDQPYDCELED